MDEGERRLNSELDVPAFKTDAQLRRYMNTTNGIYYLQQQDELSEEAKGKLSEIIKFLS